MDMNLLIAILIALVPVVVSILFARRYNIFHGLIVFLTAGYVLLFAVELLVDHLSPEYLVYLGMAGEVADLPFGTLSLYQMINNVLTTLLDDAGLVELLADNLKYAVLAAYVVIFLVSQIIASKIRKARVAKIKRLRRYLRRY